MHGPHQGRCQRQSLQSHRRGGFCRRHQYEKWRQDVEKQAGRIGKEDQGLKTNPTTKIKCPKCEHNLAYTWQVQTRSGDEGATQFFRCTKCKHTFRLYT